MLKKLYLYSTCFLYSRYSFSKKKEVKKKFFWKIKVHFQRKMAPSMVEKISIGLISILVLLKNSIPVSAEVHLIQGATPPTIKSFNLENHFYLLNEGPANQISIGKLMKKALKYRTKFRDYWNN